MACWIWYFGDLELYHNCRMHMRRAEYDYHFPPFWRLDDAHKNVVFRKECELHSQASSAPGPMGAACWRWTGGGTPLTVRRLPSQQAAM